VFYVAASSKLKFMKCTILATVLLLSMSASAQFQKGNKVLGFGLGFSSGKGETQNSSSAPVNKNNSFNGSLELGFAAKENRLHGFFAGASAGQNKSESRPPANTVSKNESQSFNGGYFTRMYKSLGKGFYVFGDLRGGYFYSQNKNINTNFSTVENTQKTHAVNVSAFPGIAYKWSNRFLLEVRTGDLISIGYNRSINSNNSNNEKFVSNSFSFNSSLGLGFLQNFGIGARWIIGKKA
jgi:hypothetical protein